VKYGKQADAAEAEAAAAKKAAQEAQITAQDAKKAYDGLEDEIKDYDKVQKAAAKSTKKGWE
jgi:predicted  nucleic acid-binding Zn-ribbon protein